MRLLAAAFLAGAVGLGAEVLWTRLLVLIVPTTVYAFSQVLIAVLLGIALGSALAAALARRLERSPHAATDSAALFALLGAVCLAAVPIAIVWLADAQTLQYELASGSSLRAAVILLGCLVPPSALIAAALPLLVCAARALHSSEAFGALYASNTLGSLLGSLLVGFVLLPWLGARGAGALLQLGCLALALVLLGRRVRRSRRIVVLAAATCLLLHFSHDVPHQIYASRLPAGTEVLEYLEGAESHVMVTQDSERRLLWINSSWVATRYGGHSGAVLAQWIPLYGQSPDETRALVRTGLEVFRQGSLWLVGNEGVLVLSNDDFELSFETLERRIAERGLAEELRRFPVERAADLSVALLLGPEGLEAWTRGAELLEDDRPFLEFRAAQEFTTADAGDRVRTILRTAAPHLDDLARYVKDAVGSPELESARSLRAARLEVRLADPRAFARRAAILESVLPAARSSLVWRTLYARLIERWLEAPETRAAGGVASAAIYQRALSLAPDLPIRRGLAPAALSLPTPR